MSSAYDALLFVSFGGPERPEDVLPFLENVTKGRGVPRERLLAVAEHYHHLGGKSPLNDQNRALIAALAERFEARGIRLPIYFGNRNWSPYLASAVSEMQRAGVQRALAFITSAYSSYSGCRQYLGDIETARAALPGAPAIEPLRRFFNHPGFIDACVERVGAARAELASRIGADIARARIVFTAHSIPRSMAMTSDYEKQLLSNSQLISDRLGHSRWDLVWQSRSGPPQVPWLEPDVLDHLRALHAEGTPGVVVAPIGFLSDHVEVLYDLDIEARELADELGLPFARAATVGTHPRFIDMIVDLVLERTEGAPVQSVGPLPAREDVCAPGCCPAPARPSSSLSPASPSRTKAGPS